VPVILYECETWCLTLREEHRIRIIEIRVLRIFGPKRDEVIGGWRKLNNEEVHNLYSSPSKIIMIKTRRMRWTGHVARMRLKGMHIRYWWEIPKERGDQEDENIGWCTILKRSYERQDGVVWTGSIWLRIGISGGLL
jgi:hypothetical protein